MKTGYTSWRGWFAAGFVFSFIFTGGALVAFGAPEEARVLAEWRFNAPDAQAWAANHCRDVRVVEGSLRGIMTDWDPFVVSPVFGITAKPNQAVEMRVRTNVEGGGHLFWVREGERTSQSGYNVELTWQGDGEWHEYRVRPYWQGEQRISHVRIDFASPLRPDAFFELAWVRVIELAQEATDMIDADELEVVAIEARSEGAETGRLSWALDSVSGLHHKNFRVKPDGRWHTCNLDMGSERNWRGKVLLLKTDAPGVEVRSVKAAAQPQGPADAVVVQAHLTEALNRVGLGMPVTLQLANLGGQEASGLSIAVKSLPPGISVVKAPGWDTPLAVAPLDTAQHTFELRAARPVQGEARFVLRDKSGSQEEFVVRVAAFADLRLPKAAYVPEPRPVRSACEIGALYYPGWQSMDKWARIWPVAPERKPLLGWYDEGNPEVVDWQIKWSVENGISFWLVDWYWHKGHQHNDHWIKAFQQARYRGFLQWAVMWANHNAPGSHSEADQRAVTQFWIENYFNMPEYYRIEDKPVVMIWSPHNMEKDLGDGGCRRLLEISRQMAVAAGHKGIWFIAMKWPEASWQPEVVQGCKEMGFDMTSIYHYMHHGGKATNPRRFHFDLVADSSYAHWQGLHETGILPFLPNLSTGWDDRPWHGDKGTEIYGRTVAHFQRICRDARRFVDETGVKRLTLAPLNEWGEGSYAEPCAEFGFGMFEAVRDAFCEEPPGGWPLNYGPRDVGLGPYDFPMPAPDKSRAWQFNSESTHGWKALMGIADFKSGAQGLSFTSTNHDPAIVRSFQPLPAHSVTQVVVRMRVEQTAPGDRCQLFWETGGRRASESASLVLPLAGAGSAHDYVFEVGRHRLWRGRVKVLRFDPIGREGVAVAIESIRLLPLE